MCMCPMEPPYITSQYKQTPPLRRRNIPNCHEGKYPELPLSGVPSPHKGEKRSKALFRTLFYNHDKNEPHETQQWVGSPALSFTFSPSFLCTPTAQPPQARTHSRSTAGPAAEGTCQQQPLRLVSQHLLEFVLHIRKPGCKNRTESKNFPSQSAWANSQGKLQQHLTG